MKKQLFILGTLLLLVIASSCNKDDDHTDPIVGTWELSKTYEDYESYVRYKFNSDKTGEYYYTEAEDGNIIDKDDPSELDDFKYYTKDNKLYITIHNYAISFNFTISKNKLTLDFEDKDEYDETIVLIRKD